MKRTVWLLVGYLLLLAGGCTKKPPDPPEALPELKAKRGTLPKGSPLPVEK